MSATTKTKRKPDEQQPQALTPVRVEQPANAPSADMDQEQVELVRRTICKDASDDELRLFLLQCRRTGLDPLSRQIHAVMRWDDRQKRKVMSIQVGIDGYRLVADRTGRYAGNDDPVYDDEVQPNKATVTVWKLVGGVRCPFTASARWEQYYPGDGAPGFMWRKMPHLMLGKVAEALALRKAFPAELSGVYVSEEIRDEPPHQDAAQQEPPAAKTSHPVAEELKATDARLAAEGLCKAGDLRHVVKEGLRSEGLKDFDDPVAQDYARYAAALFELERLAGRKGAKPDAVLAKFQIPAGSGLACLDLAQRRKAITILRAMPDAEQAA